jgi:hypothetical protein
MMDVIYQCAVVTIIALSGEHSDTGLAGVSLKTPRVPQGHEVIDGKEILTIFPMLIQDMEGRKYPTRAWTMQEAMLTRCRLVFTQHQVHLWCNSAGFCESIDETVDPANYTQSYHPQKQESWFNNVSLRKLLYVHCGTLSYKTYRSGSSCTIKNILQPSYELLL